MAASSAPRNILQHVGLDLANRAGYPVGVDSRADRQLRMLRANEVLLQEVRIDRGRRGLLEIVVLGVADESDHLISSLAVR
jgi:hypothetical protein